MFFLVFLSLSLPFSLGTFLPLSHSVLRTPDSSFSRLASVGYPWTPKYTSFQPSGYPHLRMNYVDEGPQTAPETVLLLHGTPAWSFLYREMIPTLVQAGYRVVAPDFIGCGRSDKLLLKQSYTHALHVASLVHLLDTLDLKNLTMVMQDLGGPIGSSALLRRPERVKRLVYLNTWLPQGDVFSSFSRFVAHIPYFGVRLLSLTLGNLQPVPAMFLIASDASIKEVAYGYIAPFPDARYQSGIAAWPLMIPLSPSDEMAVDMIKVVEFVKSDWRGPVLVGYSDGERITTAGQDLLESVFPSACRVTVPDAGHFLQEDQGPLVATTIKAFIEGNCKSNR